MHRSILIALAVAVLATAAPAIAAEHSVFDLVDNSAHAHLLRGGGVVVDGGSWSFPRYADGNIKRERWTVGVSAGADAGTATVALSDKRQSWLFVPLGGDEAGRVKRLRLRINAPRAGMPFSLKLNGKALPKQKTTAGWQVLAWDIPAGAAVAGENRLDLDFGGVGSVLGKKGAGALAWLSFDDGTDAVDAAPALALNAGGSRALSLPGGGGLAWYIWVPEKSSLALKFDGVGVGAGCTVDVRVEGPKGEVKATAGGAEARLDMGTLAGEVARLTLQAGDGCTAAKLANGDIVLPGAAPKFERKGPAPKHVILYIIDTLRADRLTVYNPKTRLETPHLDALAAEGTTFLQAYSQGNESYVSHAAIFTGEYPRTNGIYTGDRKLRSQHLLVSEAVRKTTPLRTAGYTSNGYIDVRNGYLQGWHKYVNALIQKKPYKAPGLLKQARKWVEKQGEKPWFLYIGTVDPHVSYRRHKGILQKYDPNPYRGRYKKSISGEELGKIKGRGDRVSKRDKARIEALYDNEVDFSDVHFGNFVQFLKDRGQWDETMVIVTADHGDEFWEHGDCGHGHSVYEELVRVPMIVRYPPLFPAGKKVREGVDTVDIFPTVLDALGQELPKRLQGTSMLRLAQGVGQGYPKASIATHHAVKYGVRQDRYKVILSRKNGKRVLYDLEADPTEQKDIRKKKPYAMRWLADAAGLFIHYEKTWKETTWGDPGNLTGVRD